MLRNASIINVFRISLAIIVIVASASSLSAFWLLEKSEQDAELINVAGSMRMHAYKFATELSNNQQEQAQTTAEKIESLWEKPLLNRHFAKASTDVENYAIQVKQEWQSIAQEAQSRGFTQLSNNNTQRISTYVNDLDQLVGMLQEHSEHRMERVRSALALASFIIVAVFFFFD